MNRHNPAGSVRDLNADRVLVAVRERRAASRRELCAETGLSRSTIAGIVADLLAQGSLREAAGAVTGPGRPTRRLEATAGDDLVVAVDLGHSHCRVGVVDAAGRVRAEKNVRLDVDASADAAITRATTSARALLRGLGSERGRVVAGAVGVPAPVDLRTGSVGAGNVLPRWVDRRPADELARALDVPFAIDNDANLGALAEARFGVAGGVDDLIYVKASTGVGAGFLLGGRLYRGADGRAGEIGHVPVDPGGAVCRCGNRGCLETLASLDQVLTALHPRHRGLDAGGLVRLVRAGDDGAARVVTDAGRLIGRVLADAVNNLNPAMVVLGGELAGDPLLDGVRESIERYAQPGLARDLRVEVGALGAHGQLVGAGALALDGARAAQPSS